MIFASILQSYEANDIDIWEDTTGWFITLTYDLIPGESTVSLKMTVNFIQQPI